MLQDTMGSPHAYVHRRNELAIISGRTFNDVHDNDVVKSYQSSVMPGHDGFVLDYIKHAQIGVVLGIIIIMISISHMGDDIDDNDIGDILFIHGGLNARNIGYVPPRDSELPYASVTRDDMIKCDGSVHQWISITHSHISYTVHMQSLCFVIVLTYVI